MAYLYGDSSPSTLTGNFLEFLRDALDFSVHLVLATQRLEASQESAEAHRQAAEVEFRRLDALGELVRHALASAAVGAADSPTARCAAAIERAAGERVEAERDAVAAKLAREVERIEGEVSLSRDGCVHALESLVKKHELPEAETAITLRVSEGGRYEALVHQATSYGLSTTVELEVPAAHAFAHVVRIDRIADRVEVSAPDLSGWLQKKVKLRPQRLEKYYLVGLSVRAGETMMRLRSEASGEGDGFDVTVGGPPVRVRLLRIGQQGDTVGDPLDYEPGEADAVRLVELRDKLAALAVELTAHRRAMRDAEFEGRAVRDCDPPARVVERLVAAMAPVVHEIARHSLSPGELVIKRLLGDDRREEIFVSRKELRAKIDQVPESARGLFDPLGLGEQPTLRPPARSTSAAAVPLTRPLTVPPAPPRGRTIPPPISQETEQSAPAIALDEKSLELVVDEEPEQPVREDSVEVMLSPEAEGSSSMPPSPPRKP